MDKYDNKDAIDGDLVTIFESNDPTDPLLFEVRQQLLMSHIQFFEEGTEPRTRTHGDLYFHIKVRVRAEDATSAKSRIGGIDIGSLRSSIPSFCPQCDNGRVAIQPNHGLLRWFRRERYKCLDCGHVWRRIDF